MPSYQVQLPDGSIAEFDDSIPIEEAHSLAIKHFPNLFEPEKPTTKYIVTTPKGEKFEVNAPDGASEQDAIAYVQKTYKTLQSKSLVAKSEFTLMTKIEGFREKYPQYNDLSDAQLARTLHSKFYSDMPFADFSQKIGLTAHKSISAGSFMHGAKSEGNIQMQNTQQFTGTSSQPININLNKAWGDAVGDIGIRALIAGVLFVVIAGNLIKKSKNTPLKNARWFAACAIALSIMSTIPHLREDFANMIFRGGLASIGFGIIGFFVGYVWRLLKPLPLNNINPPETSAVSPLVNQTQEKHHLLNADRSDLLANEAPILSYGGSSDVAHQGHDPKPKSTSEVPQQSQERKTATSNRDSSTAISMFSRSEILALIGFFLLFLGVLGSPSKTEKNKVVAYAKTDDSPSKSKYDEALKLIQGRGVAQDKEKGIRLLAEAAEQGNADAQVGLGASYNTGDGVPKNVAEAIKWWRLAAEQGHIAAQNGLAAKYILEEKPLIISDQEGVKWLRKGAERGESLMQNRLGVAYANGRGVTKDANEAAKWFYKAAEQGNSDAQLRLSASYFLGEGVIKNWPLSYMWTNLSASKGNKKAIEWRDNYEDGIMTPSQISEGQRLSSEWEKLHLK